MKKIQGFVGFGAAVLLLAAGAAGARAGGCHELVGGRRYECGSNDAELPSFSIEFFEVGDLAFREDGEVFACSCSSLGSVDRPDVEGGRGIVCVDHVDPGRARLFSARVQGTRLIQGTLTSTASGASEAFPFLCDRVE